MTETELEYQFCFNCNDRKQCYTKPKDCTRIQEETGLQEMTNEDWLRSCTTDEMVKTILDLCDYRPCFACGIGYCDDEDWCHVYSDEAKEFVVEWLKQPHTNEQE